MKRWSLFALALVLVVAVFPAPVLAPSGALPGEKLPPRAAQMAPAGEIDQTGYVKGFYVSYSAMGDAGFMVRTRELLEDTELNAVVFDFKSDRGYLSFPTQVPLATEIGAGQAPTVADPEEFLKWFKDRNVYLIARIVTFKDDLLAKGVPSWAIVDAATGGVWHDHEGMGWVDPNRSGGWDYNLALALEAASLGFDEVQFDYVRFPSDGNVGGAIYSIPNTYDNRVAALTGFFQQLSTSLRPLGVKVSADVFGYTAWVADDLGIGQHLEVIAPYIDVLAPMVYPSTYNAGLPGEDAKYHNPMAYPYEIVNKSIERTVRRARETNPRIEVRPWLQDFQDYAFDRRIYTPAEIRLQMNGARDAGARGWLLWDPAVQYTKEALIAAQPAYLPNTLGQAPVLVYDEVTAPVLREDLSWLLQEGFYPTTVADLALHHLHGVPAGRKAVVLTFDGSPASQFRLLGDGSVDPECAVGVLLAFAAAHPADFPARATFFVRPDAGGGNEGPFGAADLASNKLALLASWGFEIGLLPNEDGLLATPSAETLQQALGLSRTRLNALLPGYTVLSLALDEELSPQTKPLLASGTHDGAPYTFGATVIRAADLANSPFKPGFDPYRIPRLPAGESQAAAWREAVAAAEVFVSAGE